MTGRRYPIERTRAFLLANPHLTLAQAAAALGVSYYGLRRFRVRHNAGKVRPYIKKPLSCPEPLFSVFKHLDEAQRTTTEVAKRLGYSSTLITLWRSGKRCPTIFQFSCLCEIAGMKFSVEKL